MWAHTTRVAPFSAPVAHFRVVKSTLLLVWPGAPSCMCSQCRSFRVMCGKSFAAFYSFSFHFSHSRLLFFFCFGYKSCFFCPWLAPYFSWFFISRVTETRLRALLITMNIFLCLSFLCFSFPTLGFHVACRVVAFILLFLSTTLATTSTSWKKNREATSFFFLLWLHPGMRGSFTECCLPK